MYNKKFLIVSCMIFLMVITFASAVPPFEENVGITEGIQIFEPKIDYVQQNSEFSLHIHTSNISNGVQFTNTDVDCYIHLYNSSGEHTFESGVLNKDANGWDHKVILTEGNFSDIGQHTLYITCNNSYLGGQVKGNFWVTEGGVEITEGRSNLTMGLLAILVFLLFISLYSVFNIENYIGKFAMYWVSHLLFILITFVGWQIGVEGLLSAVALTGIFRIMFWVSIVAVVPMVFLSMAWIFYIHTYNEHFQKLLDKGVDTESAFKMAKRKSGGWFNGQ